MKIITIASVKGGVGKTTLTINIGQVLADMGYQVLVVDHDSNNNLTDYFLLKEDYESAKESNVYHFLTKRKKAKDVIFKCNLLDLIPATVSILDVAEEVSSKSVGALTIIKRELKKLDYDYVIIDTPPRNNSYELKSAIYAADIVLSPVSLSRWTIQGLDFLEADIHEVFLKTKFEPTFKLVPTKVTKAEIKKILGLHDLPMTKQHISRAAPLKTSVNNRIPIKKESKSWIEFLSLTKELVAN